MATSGAAAWQKYFRGKGDIETRLKKDSEAFDAVSKSKLSFKLSNGTEVTYLKAPAYDSKAVVRTKVNGKYVTVRVPFDNIAKPGVKSSGAASLKPQAFGVKDTVKYAPAAYYTLIKTGISERKDLNPSIKVYLNALLEHSCKKLKDQNLSIIYSKVESDLPLNDIKKDFGEVIGPLAIYYKKLLSDKGISVTQNMKIEVPLRPNEPLMDYSISEGAKKYIISAKSGETTNVVKPNDILMLIDKDPAKLKKWKNTKEYKVLKVLSENSVLIGPIKAVSYMTPTLIKESDSITEQNFKISQVAGFANKNEYLKGKKNPNINEVMYECEKYIKDASVSGELDINGIFADAIRNAVVYVKFDVNTRGIGEWSVVVSDDIKKMKQGKKAFLRTKNGYTRAADRMGVQI
jgi:hypothetical protein